MLTRIVLNKYGYEPFLDFLKGVCIVFVILTHCISPALHKYSLFCLWGDMAVPLFLLIQVFQTYKKGTNNVSIKPVKLLKRIVIPFLITQTIGVAVLFLTSRQLIPSLSKFGGIGPGAFYPYIYLQFVILLFILAPLFNRVKSSWILWLLFLLISELLELISIRFIQPDVYRFLFFRYTFLILLGWLLTKDKIVLNGWTFLLSILSMFAILVFDGIVLKGADLSMVFYKNSFGKFHWISYFFVTYILLFALQAVYSVFGERNIIRRFLLSCGKYSYEIFLFQMVFFLISPVNVVFQKVFGQSIWLEPCSLLLNVLCCTVPVIIVKIICNRKTDYVQS